MKRLWGLATCFFLLFQAALAGQQLLIQQDRNIELRIGLANFGADDKVSGTNVNLSFVTSAPSLADYEGSDMWTQALVDKLQVIHEGNTIAEWGPGVPLAGVISKTLRIASTHFVDGATITFTVKATWSLSRTGESKTVPLEKSLP